MAVSGMTSEIPARALRFADIVGDMTFIDDWDERYRYLIDLGRALPPLAIAARNEATRVRGCASQVWLDLQMEDDRLRLAGDSDAAIVKGLVALLVHLYDNLPRATAAAIDPVAALAPLGLDGHLTPQRSNGLASMLARIRSALAAQS